MAKSIHIPPNDIRAALDRLTDADEIAGSDRLCQFLSYVVEESLAGRADRIRAKTIGMEVLILSFPVKPV